MLDTFFSVSAGLAYCIIGVWLLLLCAKSASHTTLPVSLHEQPSQLLSCLVLAEG